VPLVIVQCRDECKTWFGLGADMGLPPCGLARLAELRIAMQFAEDERISANRHQINHRFSDSRHGRHRLPAADMSANAIHHRSDAYEVSRK
jgi:hypothetical protein